MQGDELDVADPLGNPSPAMPASHDGVMIFFGFGNRQNSLIE